MKQANPKPKRERCHRNSLVDDERADQTSRHTCNSAYRYRARVGNWARHFGARRSLAL
jgi:hypothetical protein